MKAKALGARDYVMRVDRPCQPGTVNERGMSFLTAVSRRPVLIIVATVAFFGSPNVGFARQGTQLDACVTWNITDNLTLAAEADYVITRVDADSAPKAIERS